MQVNYDLISHSHPYNQGHRVGITVPEKMKPREDQHTMHHFPRHSAENEHVLTNEWNNSFVDNVSGGVQSPGRGAEEQRVTKHSVSPHISTRSPSP